MASNIEVTPNIDMASNFYTMELEIPSRPKPMESDMTDNAQLVGFFEMSTSNSKKRAAEDDDMDIDMPSTKRMRTTEALDPTLPAFDSSPSSDEDFPVSNYLRRQKRKQVRSNDEQAKEGSVKDIDSEDMDADHEDNKAESRHSRKRKKAQPGNELKSPQAKEGIVSEDKDPEETDVDHEYEETSKAASCSRHKIKKAKPDAESMDIDHKDNTKVSHKEKKNTAKITKNEAQFIASVKARQLKGKISKCRALLDEIEAEAPHEIDAILRCNVAGARFARDRFNKVYQTGEMKGRQSDEEKAMYKKGYTEGKAKARERAETKKAEREEIERAGVDIVEVFKGMEVLFGARGLKKYLATKPHA